jgi:AcrR family transcriptional regulator
MIRSLDPQKREKFLQAALMLFVANGVQHTSTAEISQAAGTAAGTLFNYFPTKQDLIDALALQIVSRQSENTKARLDASMSAREYFWAIWESSIRWFMEHVDAYRYIQQVRDTGLLSPVMAEESGKHFTYYYEAIQKGFQEDILADYPLELIGAFLYQDIVAVMNMLIAPLDPGTQDKLIESGFVIFWNGIRKQA